MAPKGNNMLPNAHFHKLWQKRIKTWFDQPARKLRRRRARIAKAKAIAPRPVAGLLRSIVRCPSNRYNKKVRFGRGFTLEELKAAGVGRNEAKSIGIAVDYRRTNRSVESLQINAQRLKEYKSRLILFPRHINKPKKGDSNAEDLKLAAQLRGPILPIKKLVRREKPIPITDELKNFEVYKHLRRIKADARLVGKREKKAKEATEEGIGGGRR